MQETHQTDNKIAAMTTTTTTTTTTMTNHQNYTAKKTPDKTSEIDEHISIRFDIKKRLGKGAYGIVWKAIDRKTNDVVAIKKIFDAFRNQTDAQRTYREIFFLQAFRKHPNIIKLHSIHRALNNRDIYLGFEYMQTDLHNVIKSGNILKDIHKRYIMYQMLKATKYIHSGNVIHRDQKPSNVLIDNTCRVKIADFGLARSVSPQDQGIGEGGADPCLTDYVATRWYRAPEILIASKSYTKGVDMWSLGCILGEMLLGKPLFPGSSTVNQIERIMSCIPQPSEADILSLRTSYGSSLIRTAVKKRTTLRDILNGSSPEAIDLVSALLVFNPSKRCSAGQAMNHPYVTKFNIDTSDPVMNSDVIPPLREDLKLPINEYRNKIYELLTKRHPSEQDVIKEPSVQMVSNKPPIPKQQQSYSSSPTKSFKVIKKDEEHQLKKSDNQCRAKPDKTTTLAKSYSSSTPQMYNNRGRFTDIMQAKEKRKTMMYKNRSLEETSTTPADIQAVAAAKCRSSYARFKNNDNMYQKKPNRKLVI